ncbi:hypothetical protein IQ255_20170 [Pleurocapsales cyanobacterium LEGE 10410]|nr:hypothetical protein [Pleurocapsales cyanobacterium LEGE 10410]
MEFWKGEHKNLAWGVAPQTPRACCGECAGTKIDWFSFRDSGALPIRYANRLKLESPEKAKLEP